MTHAPFADRPRPKPGVMAIEAYVPGKSAVTNGSVKVYKLSANENPLGPSPAAMEAARAAAASLELYPDGSSRRLREAIGQTHGLDPARILAFNGSGEALALLSRLYLGPGDEGVFSAHGFLTYKVYIQAIGATPVSAPERDERADVDALIACLSPKTRMVFLTNPNNPTGTYLPATEVARLHAALRPDIMLVLDAAYAEFVESDDYDAGERLVADHQNVVMTRTLSKAYGLSGARIGWLYGPHHVIDAIDRVRDPFNVNAVAGAAGVAAMRDRAHVARSVAHVRHWRGWLSAQLTAIGLRVTPSEGNFILIHFREDGHHTASRADSFLSSRGFILRSVTAYGFPNALRMTIGTEEANRGVIAALAEFLKA